jgi:GWxTD domain-containing protein
MRVSSALLYASVALALPARGVDAQQTIDTYTARADSLLTRGDSTAALVVLDSAVRRTARNGPAWHRIGVVQWTLANSKPGARKNDQLAIRRLIAADTALKLATQFAPDSARYWVDLSTFSLENSAAPAILASGGEARKAVDAARRVGDSLMLGSAADVAGQAAWRRFEASGNRAAVSNDAPFPPSNLRRDRLPDYIVDFVKTGDTPTGRTDYAEALEFFQTAVAANPTDLVFSRHLFMALGAEERWREVELLARQRSQSFPLDVQSRLARGLAATRLGNIRDAELVFDSALSMMDDTERERLTRFTRVLRPKAVRATGTALGDSASFTTLPPAQQRGLEKMFWLLSDPLSVTAENEYRTEFLARVVWADIRWSDERRGLRGADSDIGDIYVRYGPPARAMSVKNPNSANVMIVWSYDRYMAFLFTFVPGFNVARSDFDDRRFADDFRNEVPVRWNNVASLTRIDTLPVRVARFRARGDSLDVVIAARVPYDSLVRGLDLTRAPVDVDVRVFDQFVRVTGVESVQRSVRPDSADGRSVSRFQRRVGPGVNVLRVEALQADSRRAARGTVQIGPEPSSGFGMSDLLIGGRPAVEDGRAPQRFSDVRIAPSTGDIVAGELLGLVWEVYDAMPRDGAARYAVRVSTERVDRGGIGRLAVRMLDGVGRVIGRGDGSNNRVDVTFERNAHAAPVIVETLAVELGDATAGTYRVTVEITDRNSGRRIARATNVRVR